MIKSNSCEFAKWFYLKAWRSNCFIYFTDKRSFYTSKQYFKTTSIGRIQPAPEQKLSNYARLDQSQLPISC